MGKVIYNRGTKTFSRSKNVGRYDGDRVDSESIGNEIGKQVSDLKLLKGIHELQRQQGHDKVLPKIQQSIDSLNRTINNNVSLGKDKATDSKLINRGRYEKQTNKHYNGNRYRDFIQNSQMDLAESNAKRNPSNSDKDIRNNPKIAKEMAEKIQPLTRDLGGTNSLLRDGIQRLRLDQKKRGLRK